MERGMKEMAESEHRELAGEFIKRILTGRDVTMAASIVGILGNEPGTIHFMAAGAGHFSSKTSIRSHLEKAGYTVRGTGG